MNGGDNSERGDRGDKSGSGAEAVRKRRRDKDGLCTGLLGSTRERNWVVGSQILTIGLNVGLLNDLFLNGVLCDFPLRVILIPDQLTAMEQPIETIPQFVGDLQPLVEG